MKLTLKNGKIMDTVSVEESYSPRNTQGVILSVRMNSDESVETLRDTFLSGVLDSIIVGEGQDTKTIAGYTRVDSIRKLYDGKSEYDTVVDLVKETADA